MLLRVYVDPPEKFEAWVKAQQQSQAELPTMTAAEQNADGPSANGAVTLTDAQAGQHVFEHQACVNCHTVRGTMANGRYGPDLTHLMSRDTIGSGILPNTQENLLRWINDPNDFKPGCLMPAMHLSEEQNRQITAYLLTLH
jgi:cytochrome c oxidase subunit 2